MDYEEWDDDYSLDDFEKAVFYLNRKNFPTILKTESRIVRNSLDRFIETKFVVDLAWLNTSSSFTLSNIQTSFTLDLGKMQDLLIRNYGFPLSVVSDLKRIYIESNRLFDMHINSKEFLLPEEFYFGDFYD